MRWRAVKTALVPFDFSQEAGAAVDYALDLVEDPTHLHVLHVLLGLPAADPAQLWEAADDQTRGQRARETLAKRFADPKYAGVQLHVAVGDPGHEIVDHAQQSGTDLIVLPSHGRTGVKRILIGSVAERVVRLAHCPVLVLRQ